MEIIKIHQKNVEKEKANLKKSQMQALEVKKNHQSLRNSVTYYQAMLS